MAGTDQKKKEEKVAAFAAAIMMSAFAAVPPPFFLPAAHAHKPLDAGGNYDFASATEIPDHEVSWAIYQQLGYGEAHYYRFDARAGEQLYASISIPKLDRLEDFAPSLALVGKGLEEEGERRSLLVRQQNPRQDSSDGDLYFTVPESAGSAITFDYGGPIPSKEMYEPFTQTTYWERQEVRMQLPSDGTYYLVVFDGSGGSSSGGGGKYVLAVGTVEDFSPLDFVTVLPVAWFETKVFFEDYASVSLAIAAVVAVAATATIVIISTHVARKKKKRQGTGRYIKKPG